MYPCEEDHVGGREEESSSYSCGADQRSPAVDIRDEPQLPFYADTKRNVDTNKKADIKTKGDTKNKYYWKDAGASRESSYWRAIEGYKV